MATILSNEVLPYCLRTAGMPATELEAFVTGLSEEDYAGLQAILSEQLLAESVAGDVDITEPRTHKPAVFHSIIYGGGAGSEKRSLVAFTFSNATKEALFPVAGLLIAVFTLGHLTPVNLPAVAGAAKALWTSFSVLRSPEDDDAIAVVRAMGLVRAQLRWRDLDDAPSNAEIGAHTMFSDATLSAALKQLETRKIIKIVSWGSQTGDYAHAGNRWTIKL
jgi:hypothetical protein